MGHVVQETPYVFQMGLLNQHFSMPGEFHLLELQVFRLSRCANLSNLGTE